MPKADEPVTQLATRIPKDPPPAPSRLHCVTHDTSVMDFVTEAIEAKLGARLERRRGQHRTASKGAEAFAACIPGTGVFRRSRDASGVF